MCLNGYALTEILLPISKPVLFRLKCMSLSLFPMWILQVLMTLIPEPSQPFPNPFLCLCKKKGLRVTISFVLLAASSWRGKRKRASAPIVNRTKFGSDHKAESLFLSCLTMAPIDFLCLYLDRLGPWVEQFVELRLCSFSAVNKKG